MAKKKGTKKKDTSKKTSVEVTFHGGPRDGDRMHLCNPPPPFVRLAFPDWCNYFLREDGSADYDYDMEREPIPNPNGFEGMAQRYAGTYAFASMNINRAGEGSQA